mgnify:CR=1 FL=1
MAIASRGEGGLDDTVSDVFGRTKTITIVDIEEGEVKEVEVMENPGLSFRYGAGPILLKTLLDMRIDAVIAGELGPGVSALINDHGIDKLIVKPNTPVLEAIQAYLKTLDR